MQIPSVHISFDLHHVSWKFNEQFSLNLINDYDENENLKLDENELKIIEEKLLSYLKPRKYLMQLSYYDLPFGYSKELDFKVENVKVSFDGLLKLDYDIIYNFTPQNQRVLNLNFEDNEGFFNFAFIENKIVNKDFNVIENYNLNAAFYEFSTENKIVKNTKSFSQNIAYLLNAFLELLLKHLRQLSILVYPIAFAYGFFHALMPGHSKLLCAALFLNSKKSAAIFSLKIAFFHLFNAFIYAFIFTSLNYLKLNIISSLFVCLLALFLIFMKIKKIKISKISKTNNIKKFYTKHTQSKILNIIKKESVIDSFYAFVLSLLPCPGLIFVIALVSSFGKIAFFAAILIALGMALAIFLSAFYAKKINISNKYQLVFLLLVFIISLIVFIGEL
ncbi:DUF1007 family protein [Campylobacter canadensis]|uniref:DUF1007 family protein n=1 Tax=Campylobacter canadensis TaxID=449520 RepID=A0ABS7WRM2_9BACT|nr:DUF1007 family protein [Campylobacter canadensis]MBZ7986660.1 DUF1007 family protein [Campylobacter canadensis]MBZ7993935.1 DUF1007 family protein [Campylobacter canadensis]MBZ7996251.1 DUF1007 family protein [Campylobacter canadensis]MBZ7997696.1 DUF1007 family protein [Campylobacter canadensis]MBZ7999268.1 DUF1007 family protein [Campylobacter canadensis]